MTLIPNHNLSVMIFAAGYGKRLKPLTDHTPKPLLPFKGSNCLIFLVQALKQLGFSKIYVNAHHLADQIVDFCKSDEVLIPIVEDPILETGGALVNTAHLHSDFILTLNADIWLSDYTDIERIIKAFNPTLMDELLLLCPKHKALEYKGRGDYLGTSSSKLPCMIHHRGPYPIAETVFCGIQIIKKSTLIEYAPPIKTFSLRHYFDQVEKKKRLWGIETQGNWCDIGTLDVYNTLKNIYTHST